MWKSEQQRLKPKYDILSSLMTLTKNYFVNMEEDNNQFKNSCTSCNGFVTCSSGSREIL